MINFLPKIEDRNFKCSNLINQTIDIKYQNLSNDKQKQLIVSHSIKNLSFLGYSKILKKKETKVKITNCFLIEKSNGGRNDVNHYTSYNDYFNNSKKIQILQYWKNLPESQLSVKGEPDAFEIVIQCCDLELTDHLNDMSAPEEWYSELWSKNERFQFKNGFFDTEKDVLDNFKPEDDLFGKRFFPVIVFEKNIHDNVRNIIETFSKTCSKPIVTDKYVAFGA